MEEIREKMSRIRGRPTRKLWQSKRGQTATTPAPVIRAATMPAPAAALRTPAMQPARTAEAPSCVACAVVITVSVIGIIHRSATSRSRSTVAPASDGNQISIPAQVLPLLGLALSSPRGPCQCPFQRDQRVTHYMIVNCCCHYYCCHCCYYYYYFYDITITIIITIIIW